MTINFQSLMDHFTPDRAHGKTNVRHWHGADFDLEDHHFVTISSPLGIGDGVGRDLDEAICEAQIAHDECAEDAFPVEDWEGDN